MTRSFNRILIARTEQDLSPVMKAMESGPCTIVFIGKNAKELKRRAEEETQAGIANKGRNLYVPKKLHDETPAELARYLTDFAVRSELGRCEEVVLSVSADFPTNLLLAVATAASVCTRAEPRARAQATRGTDDERGSPCVSKRYRSWPEGRDEWQRQELRP